MQTQTEVMERPVNTGIKWELARVTSSAETTPIDGLVERARGVQALKYDTRELKWSEVLFGYDSNGPLIVADGVPYKLTDHAVFQAADRLCESHHKKDMPRDYFRAWDPKRQSEELSYLKEKHISATADRRSIVVRTYGDWARAVVTNEYGMIDILPMLEKLSESLIGQHLPHLRTVSRTYIGVNEAQVSLLLNDFAGHGYGIGIRVTTDEIGKGSYGVEGLIKRTKCDNSIVVDPEGSRARIIHRGRDAARLAWAVMGEKMRASLERAMLGVQKMVFAERTPISVPNFAEYMDDMLRKLNLTEPERKTALIGSEGSTTFGGIINGITHAAKFTSDDRSVELERIAGAVLFKS